MIVMKYFLPIVLCLCLCESQMTNADKIDSISLSKTNVTSEQKVWNITVDINFLNSLPLVVKRAPGTEVRFKCEAILNFTKVEKYTKNKEGVETSYAEIPPEHIQQTILQNVKVNWLKNNKNIVETLKIKITTKIDKNNGTIGRNLKIKDLDILDEGNYTCVIKQKYEKRQTTRLIVEESIDIPTYAPLFPNTDYGNELEIVKSTPVLLSDSMKTEHINTTMDWNKSTIPQKLEPVCQEYVGKVCNDHLKGQIVYIPFNTTQYKLEEKLVKAIQVTQYSNEISSHCERYALPSLCYSTFPICRDADITNNNFYRDIKQIFSPIDLDDDQGDVPQIVFENVPFHNSLPSMVLNNPNIASNEMFNYRYNTTVLRRVCKDDCEILENELCQKEYAIAKRHPHIGLELPLEECKDLPEDDIDCLKIDIEAVMASNDECYWENGSGYLGKVKVAGNGMPCMKWSKQMHLRVSEYPELAGRHSYCRNPGGIKEQPWCFVEKVGKIDKLICDIPKCAHKIWIYIVVVLVLIIATILCSVFFLLYKQKHKNNAAAIRDINLPNADKNIYGNSRLNSPIEMTDLLNNHNINNQPHLTISTRGNGVLRIPHYSLSQIKFLEELGEGAFGKVYKGALKSNGETQYIAVKALKENASAKTQADFRREIDLISELTHDNIVCIVGVALREEPLCMLFEFMARGDLHEFLMGRAPPAGKGLPPMRLLNIALNIASGMQYLASHHYVHRDLAARNCLVSDDFVVKISDFGLSRDIYSSDYYRVQSKSLLPVRWMPPESILYGKFTTESDIWSYGVVLWEIYSYGLQPYYGYSNQEVISMVRGGELLAAPTLCPSAMYALMRDCWKHTSHRRPNFEDIVNRIEEWIQIGSWPDVTSSDASSSSCSHRPTGSIRDLQERVPLLPAHCSSSNGSLTTGSLKKFTAAGSSSKGTDDNCSTCSEMPPLAPKSKKLSSASLIDSDKVVNVGTKDTIIRIPNTLHGNEI